MARYSDEFRASAIVMLESQGYPETKGALTAVSDHLNVPQRTLRRWFKGEQNPPPVKLVRQKRQSFEVLLTDLLYDVVAEMREALEDAPLNHLATTFGITFDKLQNVKGQPNERVEHTVNHVERMDRLAAIFDAARERGSLPPDSGDESAGLVIH